MLIGAIVRDGLITITALFVLLELIAFFMAVRLSRTITRSVADLYGATKEIDHGNFAHRIQVSGERGDQLTALATSFNTMSGSLENLLEQQREKERIQSELAIAQEVQNNLFPHTPIHLPDFEYEEATISLARGDLLVAYSDGVTEPENDFGDFGENRLVEVIRREQHQPLAVISKETMHALRTWIGDAEQPDDITLVLARRL